MITLRRTLATLGALLLFTTTAPLAHADTVHAAVAANFTAAIRQLKPLFEEQTGHQLVTSFGATGQLYAQIRNGAPYDLFLAADDTTPKKLIDEGLADADSYFVYARGQLVLWSSKPGYVDDKGAVLRKGNQRIAIANPKTAPYGRAAIETLVALGLERELAPHFITGESIAQTHQFIASGNVPIGFIALAQVMVLPEQERGSYWRVPGELHEPIDQGAVRLQRAQGPAAQAFLDFLRSAEAAAVIHGLGYQVTSS